MSSWQYLPYSIDPILLKWGSLQVRYYGLMYIVAFALTYFLVSYRLRRQESELTLETFEESIIWAILGLLIGARLGDVLFYNLDYFLTRPWNILLPIDFYDGSIHFVGFSGMSYHGGLIGALVAALIFCRLHKVDLWRLLDLVSPAIPLGYTFGRIGNFINGELFGRATNVAWGMYFPLDNTHTLRHPSQLYEALGEGLLLFTVLWLLRSRIKTPGAMFALYIIGYGTVRFFIEFLREPETGFIYGFLTMGQLLCLAMVTGGSALYAYLKMRNTQR